MTDTRYFVIFGAMRTGSNLLEKTLEALGDTICYGEAFNPSFISGPRKTGVLGHTVETRDADPLAFLEHLICAEPNRIAGFRIFPGHSRVVMERVLQDPRCTPIVLTRDPIESWVSLRIARETDQWMLRHPRRRMTLRVGFDAEAFDRYRANLADHHAWLDARISESGRKIQRIRYPELQDPARLQQIAREIGSAGTVPEDAPLLRQNPASLADKVENYEDLCRHLGLVPEERTDRALVSKDRLICPERVPVAFAPLSGPAFSAAIALLHRIEVRDMGVEKIPPADLQDRAEREVLYPIQPSGGRPVFTVLSDPLERLHLAFVHEVLGYGWQGSDIRRDLIAAHGVIPPPRALSMGRAEYPADRHRAHFVMFLEIVSKALASKDQCEICAEWLPQAALLKLYGLEDRVRVFRHDRFAEPVAWVTDLLSLPPFPPGQINGLRQAGSQTLLPLDEVSEPEIVQQVREVHAADLELLGDSHDNRVA